MPNNEIDPNQVVLQLLARGRELQDLSDRLDVIEMEAVHAKEAHTVAFAKAFLSAKGSNNDARKQQALLDTATERLTMDIALATVGAMKNQIATLKVRIEIGRSAAALVRAEASLLNTGNTRR